MSDTQILQLQESFQNIHDIYQVKLKALSSKYSSKINELSTQLLFQIHPILDVNALTLWKRRLSDIWLKEHRHLRRQHQIRLNLKLAARRINPRTEEVFDHQNRLRNLIRK